MSTRSTTSLLSLRGFAVPALAVAALGALAGSGLLEARELRAAPAQRPGDPDLDGLVNLQETVLGTNRFQSDTDGDGYSDLEELARKSSPLYPQSIPENDRLRVGMSCRGGDHELYALIALYLPDGKLRDKDFHVGVVLGGRMVKLSQNYLRSHAQLELHDARGPEARIATLELPISPRLVRHFGDMCVFATLGDKAHGIVQAADAIHLIAFGPTIVLQVQAPTIQGTSMLNGTARPSGGSGSGGLGSIYVPLSIGDEEPGWTAGQVCVQQTVIIGANGPLIIQEIISAECQDGWDGFCPTNCAGTIGNTYTTVDPLGLIGG